MLTQHNLFPHNPMANSMNAYLSVLETDRSIRCIKNFYTGLKWADEFGICGGYKRNRNFHGVFQIDDDDVLGVFDSRNSPAQKVVVDEQNPRNLTELIAFYKRRQGNIKTLIVLEKENRRLASSDTQGYQSKFLIDTLLPSILGIRTHYDQGHHRYRWQKTIMQMQALLHQLVPSVLHSDVQPTEILLKALHHHPKTIDNWLFHNSLLGLFYKCDSPFLELDAVNGGLSAPLALIQQPTDT
ncbi:MAG: hypothetical protein AAFN93_15465 [Bacteroidota bacterium]